VKSGSLGAFPSSGALSGADLSRGAGEVKQASGFPGAVKIAHYAFAVEDDIMELSVHEGGEQKLRQIEDGNIVAENVLDLTIEFLGLGRVRGRGGAREEVTLGLE